MSIKILTEALNAKGFFTIAQTSAVCPYVALPSSFEEYLNSRSASTRESYQRSKRKLAKDYARVLYGKAQTPEEVTKFISALIQLHQSRWLQQGFPGLFSAPEFVDFHCSVAQKALQANMLRLYYLQVNDEVVAVCYCYRIADTMQFYLGAFDERYSKYSPGILINAFAIEQSILEGAKFFDFLEGEERYKRHWMTHTRGNIVLRVFRPNWGGQFARMDLIFRNFLISTARYFFSEKTRLAARRILQRLHISI